MELKSLNIDELLNAKIGHTFLGIEDHGILAFNIDFEVSDHTFQGTGAYIVTEDFRDMLWNILRVVGVSEWSRLDGSFCRIGRKDGLIKVIGNLMGDIFVDLRDTRPTRMK